jgi:hypothetical protein
MTILTLSEAKEEIQRLNSELHRSEFISNKRAEALEFKDALIGELVDALDARGTWSRPHDAALVEKAREATASV